MPRYEEQPPTAFARAVTHVIRDAMQREQPPITGRGLAKVLQRSEKYVRSRLNDEFQFDLNDIERLCEHLDVDPGVFVLTANHELPVGGSDDDLAQWEETTLRSVFATAADLARRRRKGLDPEAP